MKFWNTEQWRKYVLAATYEDSEDLTFDIIKNDKKLATVYLIQEGNSFSYQHGPCPKPTLLDDIKTSQVLDSIDELALKHNVDKIHIRAAMPNYINNIGFTCIINPMYNYKPRKGHLACIHRGEKFLKCETSTDIMKFMTDYFTIAGKETRPEKSFKILGEFINNGKAVLFKAKYQNKTAGYTLIITYLGQAYYFMSASFPEFQSFSVGHFLQHNIINYLKQRLVKHYEIGEQSYNSLYSCPDKKESNISLFKRGFGGNVISYCHSEYYWNKELLRDTLLSRVDNYVNK